MLIYARLILGILVLFSAILNVAHYASIAVTFLTVGLFSDVFDGIIARRLNVSTIGLRRLDSTIDQIFFLCIVIATYLQRPTFFSAHLIALGLLMASEALIYVVSFWKFKREVATHSIGAKFWTLSLFATLVDVTLKGDSTILFQICFWFGIITRIEIVAILAILRDWTSDVPSFLHALRLRRGEEITRNRLFNG